MTVTGFQEGKDYYLYFLEQRPNVKEALERLIKSIAYGASSSGSGSQEDFRIDTGRDGESFYMKFYDIHPDIKQVAEDVFKVMETSASSAAPDNAIRFQFGKYTGMTAQEVLSVYGEKEIREVLSTSRKMSEKAQEQIFNICFCAFRKRCKKLEMEKTGREECVNFFNTFSPLIPRETKSRIAQQAGFCSFAFFLERADTEQLKAAVDLVVHNIE